MAEVTREALRLLIVPDKRTLLSTDGVSMTATSEAGPRPGVVLEAQTTPAVFTASGDLDSELTDIEFGIARSGGPGDCEARWRHAAEGMRSWDPPSAISEFEFIARTTTAGKYSAPHACRLTSGLLVVVVTDASTAITCFRQSAAGKWTSSTVATVAGSRASVCQLPSGRLLCVYTAGNTTTTQIKMAYSDDAGATWTIGNQACLNTPMPHVISTFTTIRVCVLGGEVSLWVRYDAGATPTLYQFVSADLGATFRDVVRGFTGAGYNLDVAVRGNTAYILFLAEPSAGVLQAAVVKMTTAGSSIEDAVGTNVFLGTISWSRYTALAILADDDGTLWVYGRDESAGGYYETQIFCSTDDGATWDYPFEGSAHAGLRVAAWGVATSYLTDFCVVPERGRAVMIHTSTTAPANDDDSLMACYLGGWSTVALPHDSDYDRMLDVGGWDVVWLPFEKPESVGWTLTTSGGGETETLASTGLELVTGIGEFIRYTRTTPPVITGTAAAKMAGIEQIVQVKVPTVGGGTFESEIKISDGANDHSVRLEVTKNTIRFYDIEAGAYIAGGATSTTDPPNGVCIWWAVDSPTAAYGVGTGRVRGYYRATGDYTTTGPKADRQWTAITGSTTLVRAASGVCMERFGVVTAGAATPTVRWLGYSPGVYIAGGDALADPTRGRQVPDRTSPVHIEKGLRVAMVSGPALIGQVWNHTTAHDYPVEATDVSRSPSPAKLHRSTSDAVQQDIIWHLDGGWQAGDLVALYLDGCNWRTASLYRDAGAANKVMDIDLGYSGFDYVRTRDFVSPAQSGTALPFYVREGTIDGATLVLNGATRRKVRHARGGMWPAVAGTFPLAHLELESYAGGDPAAGSGELWLPRGLFLTTLMQSTDTITLRIDAQTTADGYHQTGIAMVGRAVALALQYGWGRAYEVESSVDLTTLIGGARRARQLAENRPAYEVAWAEGSNQIGLYTATAPPYVSIFTGGHAHGDYPGTLPAIAGLLGELGGSKTPGVLCMRVPTQASAPTTGAPIRVLDPAMLCYGRITTQTWRNDSVLGEEGTDPGEVVRGGVLRIESEL